MNDLEVNLTKEELIQKMLNDNIRLIFAPTHKFYERNEMIRKKYEFEELLSVATLGLHKACQKFDESKGFKFSTYAIALIEYELKGYARKDKWYFNRRKINGQDKFEAVDKISISASMKDNSNKGNPPLSVEEILVDKEEVYKDLDTKIVVDNLLSTCVDRERAILEAYFFDEKPQSQLAKDFKTSQSFISLVIKRNLVRFKEILGEGDIL